MTINVLSPYRFFFTDEEAKVWSFMKDGRVCQMGQADSFSCFSSDQRHLTGVRFKGEDTDILMRRQPFLADSRLFVLKCKGFCYYPSLLTEKPFQLAFLKADLLHEKGKGTLQVYKQARKKYHLVFECLARISPPIWEKQAVYFLNGESVVCRVVGNQVESLGVTAELFDVRNGFLAWYEKDVIRIRTPQKECEFTALQVTALSLSQKGQYLYFAARFGEKERIYSYRLFDGYIKLVHTHPCKVCGFSAAVF